MNPRLVLTFATVLGALPCAYQQCFPPEVEDLEGVVASIVQIGDGSQMPVVDLTSFNVVCRAYSSQEGLLRYVSVVVNYTCTGHSNCPPDTAVEQIESGCQGGSWTDTVSGSSEPSEIRTQTPEADLSTTARDDCSVCFSPLLATDQGATTDPVTHCVGE